MKFRIEKFSNGQVSLQDLEAGQTMHSSIGPWAEAQQVYIEPSGLLRKLQEPHQGSVRPFVLYDVGMGIAANALAAFECFQRSQASRDFQLISFENDDRGLREVLANTGLFKFVRGHEKTLRTLLNHGIYQERNEFGSSFIWRLERGDFRETLKGAPSPDVVFYDFYSIKVCPDLWGVKIFSQLREKAKGKMSLFTYSSSTAVRTALLLAGFYVGYGRATEVKKETTISSTCLGELDRPLDREWLEHWKRSGNPLPIECRSEIVELNSIYKKIETMVI